VLVDDVKYTVKVTKEKLSVKCILTIERDFEMAVTRMPAEIGEQQRAFADIKESLRTGIVCDMIKDSLHTIQRECNTGHTFRGVKILASGVVPNDIMILGPDAFNLMESMMEMERRYAPYKYPPGVLFT